LTVNLLVSINTTSAPIGPSVPTGQVGGDGANAVHDCQWHVFDQRVFVTSRRDTSGLLPSTYVGGRAGGTSWCRQLTADQLSHDYWLLDSLW